MVLSTGELALLRDDLSATLPETCGIVRVTRASDGAGGWSETTATVASVACRLAPLSAREAQIAASLDAAVEHVVTLPAATDVRHSDRITLGARTFEVTQVRTRSEELVRRVWVVEAAS